MTDEGPALLVVDDNEDNRYTLTRRLKREGYTNLTTANDGREALEALAQRPFDLVLLDIMMPVMNGYEVLEHINGDEALRDIPVIMISALDDIDSVVKCIELGAQDYLPKPFNPVLLRARIGACLEKKRLRDREVDYLREIEAARKRSDELLSVILPLRAVEELKATDNVTPRRYDNVAVLFADIVSFTSYCDANHPETVVSHLQAFVEAFEELAVKHGLEKIKTIGDAFMATAGLLEPVDDEVLACVRCGLDMVAAAQELPAHWHVRVGIHHGPVVAGIVGRRKYSFDLWGDTVNTAARVCSHAGRDAVVLSETAWRRVADHCRGESLGGIPVKGKGEIEMFRCDAVDV